MTVGVLKITLLIPGSRSLKTKRQIVRSIKEKIKGKFNISIAEVGDQDLWQRCELGIAAVNSSRKLVESMIDKIINNIELNGNVRIIDCQREIL
ncbi:MAG: DUF503 domain-containing protein [Candidatus Schekmanbacteria bacterium]|nr:MAG: DUF503 domain-containing protein [Candidatus Schekmanbacteria bacterium]